MKSLNDSMRIPKNIRYDEISHVRVFLEGLPQATLLRAQHTLSKLLHTDDDVEAIVAFEVPGSDTAVLQLAVLTGHPEDGVHEVIGQY